MPNLPLNYFDTEITQHKPYQRASVGSRNFELRGAELVPEDESHYFHLRPGEQRI